MAKGTLPTAADFAKAKEHGDVEVDDLNLASGLFAKKQFPLTVKVVFGRFVKTKLTEVKAVGTYSVPDSKSVVLFYEALTTAKKDAKINDKRHPENNLFTGCLVVDTIE